MDDETVLLHLEFGKYYSLDQVGSVIWELLSSECTVERVHDQILERYDVESPQAWVDLCEILRDLAAHSLVEVVDG